MSDESNGIHVSRENDNEKRYENLNGVKNEHGFRDMLKWMKERREKSKDLSENIPKAVTRDVRDVAVNRTETAITWI